MTAGATIETLLALDAQLAANAFPALSPRWCEEATRFYSHATARTWAARIGRGGAKSTTGAKVALNETLFGVWTVPPGERHYAVIVSENREEASGRLRLLEGYLRALGVRFNRSGDVIDLLDMPRGFRVCSCRIGGVSGFRSYFLLADELAKWGAYDDGADPPNEVLASARAMQVTHAAEGPRTLLFSSAFGVDDAHFRAIELGETVAQIVSLGPTWEFNPSVTEEQTHQLEADERTWRREYCGIPQGAAMGAFDADHVARAFRPIPTSRVRAQRAVVIDPSSGKGDSWTWCVVSWTHPAAEPEFIGDMRRRYVGFGTWVDEWIERRDARGERIRNPAHGAPPGPPILHVEAIDGIEGRFAGAVTAAEVVAKVAKVCAAYGVETVHSDQREAHALASLFGAHGVMFAEHPWSAPSKVRAVERVRAWMRDGEIVIAEHGKMREQLLSYEERIVGSSITYGGRRGTKDDYAALLLSAAMADIEGQLSMSPIGDAAPRNEALAEAYRRRVERVNDMLGGKPSGYSTNLRLLREGKISRLQWHAWCWDNEQRRSRS